MTMSFHPHFKRFHSVDEQESIKGISVTSQGFGHSINPSFHKIDIATEQNAADSCTMTVQKLGGGMNDKINTVTKRLLQVGGSKSIITGSDQVILFCQAAQFFDVHALNGGVGWSFYIKHFNSGIILNSFLCFVQVTQICYDGC